MSIIAPEDTPVWADEHRCKACNICASYCPAGALAMHDDIHAVPGQTIEAVYPESRVGCTGCETRCPDFAIMVAKRDEFKFARLSPGTKERALAVKNNKYEKLA